jgi:uncharacterized protein YuzE
MHMNTHYDADADELHLWFSDATIHESHKGNTVITDYDKEGKIVRLRILKASRRIKNLRASAASEAPERSDSP